MGTHTPFQPYEPIIRREVTMTKEQAQIYKEKGNVYFQVGNFEDALDSFTDAIKEDEDNHVLYSNRSGTYVNLEIYELAIEDAEKVIELNPTWPKGYSRLGTALFNDGQVEEAKKAFEKGLKFDPQNAALKEGLRSCETTKSTGMPLGMPNMHTLLNDPEFSTGFSPAVLKKMEGKMSSLLKNPSQAVMLLSDPDPEVRAVFQKIVSKFLGGGKKMPD